MAHPKDKYYWTQLRAALTAGQWSAPYPAKAPNGTALSWPELFRKFNKHCRGFKDVTEVASQTRVLALLLAANSKDEDQDDVGKAGESSLSLGDDTLLPEERIEEGRAGYEALKKLESNFDTLNFALAYYAYALGRPAECLDHLGKVPDVSHVQSHIPSPAITRSSTMALQVPGAGVEPSSSSGTGSFVSESSISVAEIKDGRAWAMTETFRSLCLQGMSLEKLSPDEPKKALKAYGAAFPLLTIAESEIASNSAPTSAGKIDFTSFMRFRELWRWVERLIWRAVVLAAQTTNIHERDDRSEDSLWNWLAHYTSCSSYWPPTFRTQHRSTISILHLRALILQHGVHPTPSTDLSKPPQWLHTARTVVQEYRAILSVSTKFPRAGERNVKVEDFVDLCVAVWEASGAIGDYAGWVIDVLWWATRLTFNSDRILRHMTRLLRVSGDTPLAKRTLRLYVQIVGKGYQTRDAGTGADADTDRQWVETLIQGARMLCKAADGVEDVREAGVLIDKAKTRLDRDDKELVASVDLAEGIWSCMMLREQDPHTRPARLSHSHILFLRSIDTFPTPSGYYHLALSFARPGPAQDLDQAIVNAGLAMEGDPKEIRYWHLLGLLLAATEQWKAAQEILEQGAQIGEFAQDDGGTVNESSDTQTLTVPLQTNSANASVEGLQVKDFGATKVNGTGSSNGSKRVIDGLPNGNSYHPVLKSRPALYLLNKDTTEIPPASDLLHPTLDHPPPSLQEVFEHALQLRMTQVAVTEYVEGAEGAGDKWVEVFGWIAEKRGIVAEQPRASMDVGRLPASSELNLLPQSRQENGGRHSAPHSTPHSPNLTPLPSASTEPPIPIPITISPATPDDHPSHHFSPEQALSETEDFFSGEKHDGEPQIKRSHSMDRDTSKSKKVQRMLKNRVHKGRAGITTISKKIGNGVVRTGSLRRSNSTPDFHAVLHHSSYQASSIHSRTRLSSFIRTHDPSTPTDSPPPPPPPALPSNQQTVKWNSRSKRESRLLSDLWLMSAATFRRLGKIEQAKGAIQEAEVRDEDNPAVWVQLGLYYAALGQNHHAIDAFHKALFISPDDVAAAVHLCRLYLSRAGTSRFKAQAGIEIDPDNVDLAAGMLSHLTRGVGWDVPEAWYYLAKAYGMQERKDRERECLSFALELSEHRGVRDIGTAVGWCI